MLRKEDLIPAELYGHGVTNLHLAVPTKDFLRVFKEAGESTVLTLVVNNERRPVLIFNVKTDPVKDTIIHADFYQVRLDEKLKAHVPVVLEGVATGVKEKGGILTHAMHEIEVEALPADLPHDIKVDISVLDDIGKSLHVKDLPLMKAVRYLADPDTVVASVSEKAAEEALAAGPAGVEEVKVEGEEKQAEEGEEIKTAKESATPKTQEKREGKK